MAILKLNYDRAGYEGLAGMELSDWDMAMHQTRLRGETVAGSLAALVVIENLLYAPSDADYLLARREVSMNRNDRTRFERIEHPHRPIAGRVSQVIMHA